MDCSDDFSRFFSRPMTKVITTNTILGTHLRHTQAYNNYDTMCLDDIWKIIKIPAAISDSGAIK